MNAPDTAILALNTRRVGLLEEERRRDKSPIGEEISRVSHEILDTPAEGPADIAVKLDMGLDAMDPDPREKDFDDLDWDIKLIVSALMDAERLAEGGGP